MFTLENTLRNIFWSNVALNLTIQATKKSQNISVLTFLLRRLKLLRYRFQYLIDILQQVLQESHLRLAQR